MDQTSLHEKPAAPKQTVAGGLAGGGKPVGSPASPQASLEETRVGGSERPGSNDVTLVGSDRPPAAPAVTEVGSSPPQGRARTRLQEAAGDTARRGTNIDPDWLTPGGRIRQYELIRQLGAGGMGTVWLARDTRLGRRVAIKVLGLSDPIFRDRFLVEARATAQCQHDNIVVIHEVDEHQGTPLMVLEYLEGKPLTDLVEDRIVPAPRAVDYMIPVVQALSKAHEQGLAHRDLKPDNIIVTDVGTVKVLDFGIAKLFHEKQGTAEPQQKVTIGSLKEVYRTVSTGSLVGTLPYMSPEQWGT